MRGYPKKREHDAISRSEDEEHPPSKPSNKALKRSRTKPEAKGDVVYGQRCVFPGLDNATARADDDLEWEDEGDALEYLRSVRLEAIRIPCLLVAPKSGPQLPPEYLQAEGIDPSPYHNGIGDARGYYQDGAYTAVPDVPSSCSSDHEGERHGVYNGNGESTDRLRDDAFYKSLIQLFLALRARLHQNPPSSAVARLPPRHEVTVGPLGPNSGGTFLLWQTRVQQTDPLPVQVAAMDRDGAMRLLRIILRGKMMRRGFELRERTSRWIWSLLARLPDRGEMNYVDVGWIRELGKRAVLMLVSIAHMAALQEEVDGDLDGEDAMDMDEDDDDDKSEQCENGAPEKAEAPVRGDGMTKSSEDAIDMDEDEDGDKNEHCQNGAPEKAEAPVRGDGMTKSSEDAQLETSSPDDTVAPDANGDGHGNNSGKTEVDIAGEVMNAPSEEKETPADLGAMKERLLSQLEEARSHHETSPAEKGKGRAIDDGDDDWSAAGSEEFDEERSRLNMRATLNMILTVAGELYGQKDLLEFRNLDL